MSNQQETDVINVKIMDREFKIKCPKNKIIELQEASSYLNDKMRDISNGDKFITIDRIAVAAALNIAHELILEKRQNQSQISELNKRVFDLKNKLCQTLENTS